MPTLFAILYLCPALPECEERSLRLVDGIIDNEGRIEVCLQGVWGTICSESGWDPIDAYVACKQLKLGTSGIGEWPNEMDCTEHLSK